MSEEHDQLSDRRKKHERLDKYFNDFWYSFGPKTERRPNLVKGRFKRAIKEHYGLDADFDKAIMEISDEQLLATRTLGRFMVEEIRAAINRLKGGIVNQQIIDAIQRERDYQDRKWGVKPHPVGSFILIMQGELEEAAQAWRKSGGDGEALRELLQVIAVGVACLEQHGVVERGAQS